MIFYVFELIPMKWSLSASMILLCIKGLNWCVTLFIHSPSTCQSSQINCSVQMGFLSCLKLNSQHCNFHLMVTPSCSQSLLRQEEKCEFMWIESSNTGYCVFLLGFDRPCGPAGQTVQQYIVSIDVHAVVWICFWHYQNFGYFENQNQIVSIGVSCNVLGIILEISKISLISSKVMSLSFATF